ncbi:hypothetical protein RchiOBHm_Chr1g0344411 [Rosa chinensis]|uniref:Uncharacterized protein n=1 Tax=Rosa chinensis TaxID=74649 RepID=A0A2P6SEH8_ROSCH|nr:hypothetical protein RchiOBHm_Chr1g0344411 [Rosa chinensis]
MILVFSFSPRIQQPPANGCDFLATETLPSQKLLGQKPWIYSKVLSHDSITNFHYHGFWPSNFSNAHQVINSELLSCVDICLAYGRVRKFSNTYNLFNWS